MSVRWRNQQHIGEHKNCESTTSPNSKSLRHPLLLHGSRIFLLSNRHLFALVACSRLAGVRTQVDMSRLTGLKSKYQERHEQGHAPSGLNGASQDFEQAGRAPLVIDRVAVLHVASVWCVLGFTN